MNEPHEKVPGRERNWNAVYALVIGVLVVVIVFLYLFSSWFR